ncbi:MAG: VCBS repeat-containing protein [Bacteroidota bacterium]
MPISKVLYFLLIGVWVVACSPATPPLMERIEPAKSGIDFVNEIIESDTFNVLNYIYLYNGAGVGVGDFNQDDKPDIFFAGNMSSCRLYLNQGEMKFADATEIAGLQTDRWCTGIAVVDINADGREDIYVSTVNPNPEAGSANYLFVNLGNDENGQPRFEDQAAKYGLDDTGYSTQAAFLDYDQDGDLDMYLLTNSASKGNRNSISPIRSDGSAPSTDRLYENRAEEGFVNVSHQAGILIEGWGLGVAIVDINQDGWSDIYVANDFLTNDILYINQKDGSFRDEIGNYFKHESFNSMGIDIADINNDARPDIMVLDMMPEDNRRQKSMFPAPNYDRFHRRLRSDYRPQYVRNVLQLQHDNAKFSEIGQLAGVFKTDWSWTPLMIDLDNDAWRDILITNGYHRDVTDLDYVAYTNGAMMFGSDADKREKMRLAIEKLEGVKKHNYLYQNQGSLRFRDRSQEWGFDEISYSNGAAYADFDQDGDLDVVINNINDPAFLYENHSIDVKAKPQSNHYLRVKLEHTAANPHALGAKVWLRYRSEDKEQTLYQEQTLYRGYKSTVEPILHFGLGQAEKVEEVKVRWPDGQEESFAGALDTVLRLQKGQGQVIQTELPAQEALLTPISLPDWQHQEGEYNDFLFEYLLPQKYSQAGPGMAVGDIDGDGVDELFVGGSARFPAQLFRWKEGELIAEDFLPQDAAFEDMGALFFDADGDEDLDLYVVSGSNEFSRGDSLYQDRFYRNDGQGNFTRDKAALPELAFSGGMVSAADIDHDGDLDLFVAGKLMPRKYPLAGQSLLLINEGGYFVERSDSLASGLSDIGMVNAALWTDVNGDGWRDLLLAGEWMPLTLFTNQEGRLIKTLVPAFAQSEGWWNSLIGQDFDQDGDIDYVAGNLGWNSRFKASLEEPICLYLKDYDGNGQLDPILCQYIQGVEYTVHPRDQLGKQIAATRGKFNTYYEYGKTPFKLMMDAEEMAGVKTYQSYLFATTYIENLGNGDFKLRALPVEAQFSPTYGMQTGDFNADGFPDLALIGNSYANNTQHGYYDAGVGSIWLGDGNGGFQYQSPSQSGFWVDGDAKSMVGMSVPRSGKLLIAAQNRGPLKAFEQKPQITLGLEAAVAEVEFQFEDGRIQKQEIYWGMGYLSQSSRSITPPQGVAKVIYRNSRGEDLGY